MLRINFLTTDISDASGGAIYDKNFYNILIDIYPNTKLLNDKWFINKYNGDTDLFSFNRYYKDALSLIFDCDYLLLNSRLYTRFVLSDFKKGAIMYPRTKIIVVHHHSNYMTHKGILKSIHKKFERNVLCSANELIIPNQYVIDQVQHDLNNTNIKYLPSSFEKKDYSISALNSKMLLFVGNIERRKGIIYGLKAFNIIHSVDKDTTFHLAGNYNKNDTYYKELLKYIKRHDLKDCVVFEGRVDNSRLNWLYSNANLFLFPSLLEGYGLVMIEAMSRGVPVVAFDNSAMPYTVQDNINGLLIRNRDANEMAQRTIELLNNAEKMSRMQSHAIDTYKKTPDAEQLRLMIIEYIRAWR